VSGCAASGRVSTSEVAPSPASPGVLPALQATQTALSVVSASVRSIFVWRCFIVKFSK
jgi:hypothetical protein